MSDILVVLPPLTADDLVLFAKNSDRPPTEVQEVVYYASAEHEAGTKLHCTFIEIDQVPKTNAVILSKAAWSWGAEMGANEHNVCIGNTAVWTKFCHPGDHEEKLIGCDFVRLALERADTARQAVNVITSLLATHGQGGHSCEDRSFGQWTYNNSYVIVDKQEAWLLETAGKVWAAKKVTTGLLLASSCLSIETDADITSDDLCAQAHAIDSSSPIEGPVNFSKVFSANYEGISLSETQLPENRLKSARDLLEQGSKQDKIEFTKIVEILRNEEKSINFVGELLTVGSQISVLAPPTSQQPSCHWFTATPFPNQSVFKPFIFCENAIIGNWTLSPSTDERLRSTFQTSVDRRHPLYKAHEKGRDKIENGGEVGEKLHATIRDLEKQCMMEVMEFLKTFDKSQYTDVHNLFSEIAESEMKFYIL